ncbi:hypothetical protein IQ06DRAFT_360341 [Phaeosphaeriaceae sp. SRC1lsM3a]|nr:hypothetical protein IQ06DRAFT_360341 [Stagonospora sp. SRC1lsM3a]
MASFGKVLDLLDERYLNLQDVYGNVEPLPSLVPYEDYVESILVYRMDANHEILLGLLHEFTANMSQQLSQELWTWFVQWDVDTDRAPAPSPKKIRLDHAEPQKRTDEDPKQRRDPIIDIFERCVIDSKLFEQEEMLRILIDIVQVESSIVPNYIEFLYRWIDFHEGDGKALKAALKWEIPSLWDFEYHPLLLPEDLKKTDERHRLMEAEERNTEQLAEALPTNKMREKPDLAAIERQTEASERLQYREVKYGIQPPKVDTPLPPLINIPRNPLKRLKYYAACYRSRQRALVILMEAGLSMKQIGAYQRLQDESVQDTPTREVPEESRKMPGLRHYHKDSDAAQLFFKEKEKLRSQREKQAEIALSERLMSEAQVGAQRNASDGSSGVPLIPATPSYSRRPDMAADMLARIQAARGKGEERINFVPSPIVGLMNARLFEDARDRQLMSGPNRPGQSQMHQSQIIPGRDDEDMVSSEFSHPSAPNLQPQNDFQPTLPALGRPPTALGVPEANRPTLPFLPPPVRPPNLSTPSVPQAIGQTPSHPHGNSQMQNGSFANSQLHSAPQVTPSSGQGNQRMAQGMGMFSGPPQITRTTQVIQPAAATPRLPSLPQLPARANEQDQTLPGSVRPNLSILQSVHTPTLPMPMPANSSSLVSPSQRGPLPTPTLSRPGALPRTTLGVSGPSLQRTSAPNPLSLAPPPPSPLTSLAPSFLCTTPFRNTHTNRIPILIYFPRILVPGLPHPFPLGDNHSNATDAFMLGYTDDELSDASTIDLSKALFLPTGCWTNVIGKVQRGKWKVLETYQSHAPPPIHPKLAQSLGKQSLPVKNPVLKTPHHAAYTKLSTAFSMMQTPSPRHREASVTKRWRATPGPMSLRDRGAVWEGWGAVVDKGINMSAEEREGALAIGRRSKEEERIERELEELMEWEEENGVEWD